MKRSNLVVAFSVLSLSFGPLAHAAAVERDLSTDITSALQNGALTVPVSGVLDNGGVFKGMLAVTSFAVNEAGKLVVNGNIIGTATSEVGSQPTAVSQPVSSVPVAVATPTGGCDIVTLNLDALHLDVLGLDVDLSPVDLLVNAVPGAGNLVGNLLCAVTHLLDNPLTDLAGGLGGLLKQINDIVGGLLGGLGGATGGAAGAGTGPALPQLPIPGL